MSAHTKKQGKLGAGRVKVDQEEDKMRMDREETKVPSQDPFVLPRMMLTAYLYRKTPMLGESGSRLDSIPIQRLLSEHQSRKTSLLTLMADVRMRIHRASGRCLD